MKIYLSTFQLLRFHFSFFLMPVYWFAMSQLLHPDMRRAMLVFFIIHFLLYPSSNGYNSYMDRDEESIGGLKTPLAPTRQLYYVTLTMDLLGKDPNALGAKCTDCHARTGAKPKLLPEIPSVKLEGGTDPTVMNNQQAFHHACGDCHDAVAKAKPDSTGPTSKKCTACHKKSA